MFSPVVPVFVEVFAGDAIAAGPFCLHILTLVLQVLATGDPQSFRTHHAVFFPKLTSNLRPTSGLLTGFF